jgi:hypothetical protein
MPVFQSNIQIAVGNNNTAGLVAVEALTDSNGRFFEPVQYYPNTINGVRQLRGDLLQRNNGITSHFWISAYLSFEGYFYIYNTLLAASISAPVTIRTAILRVNTFANYNCILTIPELGELERGIGYTPNFRWSFTNLTVITP